MQIPKSLANNKKMLITTEFLNKGQILLELQKTNFFFIKFSSFSIGRVICFTMLEKIELFLRKKPL